MGKYIAKRLLMMIPVILGVVLVVFTILRLSPTDPIRTILGDMASQEEVDQMREEVGLNDPFPIQFFNYLKGILTKFDFGYSWVNKNTVVDEIKNRFPITLQLAILSTLLATAIGIPLGIISAIKQYSLLDNIVSILALIFLAMPGFWFALMLIITFSLKYHLFPASGWYGLKYMVLPIIASGTGCVAGIMRTMRSNMLEVIRQDYIRTARAKGLKERTIIVRHALRNALIPVVTLIGMQFGRQLGGVFVLETIFAIPGMGKMLVDACSVKNIPIVQGGVIFIAVVFGVVNLIVDILYSFIDPRMSSQYKGGKKEKKGATANA
ncbi:MAG: ABC transporter permease [Ruminococcaceae bacterium]|nr:ABC transporter permease [Oscillospiraceae bacterium]